MARVFINFRGRDQAGYAALLDRELSGQFGAGSVFLSSRSIAPGDDFAAEILRNVKTSTVLLAVIGPDWIELGAGGVRGGGSDDVDWVHREIAEALAGGIRVIPVLVEGAPMPPAARLPDDIAALSRCQYLRLHHRNIEYDVARIVEVVSTFVPHANRDRLGRRLAPHGAERLFRLAATPDTRCRIGFVAGSILNVTSVAIWVNSENTDMDMSRFNELSVSAIIRYSGARRDEAGRVTEDLIGRQLAEQVGVHRPVPACAVFVTDSGALRTTNDVTHIMHVAATYGEPGAGFHQAANIGRCVTTALAEAERLAATAGARTIIFPILGTGVAGAEVMATVTTLVGAATDYLAARPDTGLSGIYFLAYTEAELVALERVLTGSARLAAA